MSWLVRSCETKQPRLNDGFRAAESRTSAWLFGGLSGPQRAERFKELRGLLPDLRGKTPVVEDPTPLAVLPTHHEDAGAQGFLDSEASHPTKPLFGMSGAKWQRKMQNVSADCASASFKMLHLSLSRTTASASLRDFAARSGECDSSKA